MDRLTHSLSCPSCSSDPYNKIQLLIILFLCYNQVDPVVQNVSTVKDGIQNSFPIVSQRVVNPFTSRIVIGTQGPVYTVDKSQFQTVGRGRYS